MVDEWIFSFSESGFVYMSYPFAFTYRKDFVPKRYVYGFTKYFAQYAVVARFPGLHPERFSSQF